MILHQCLQIRNRKHAAILLSQILLPFKGSSATVIGIPYGGAVLGFHIAERLHLRFGVIACRTISDPADRRKAIGAITANEVMLHRSSYDMPSGYIHRQVSGLQNEVRQRQAYYESPRLSSPTAIIVTDMIDDNHAILAVIRDLKTRGTGRLIVAASMITDSAARELTQAAIEVTGLAVVDRLPGDGAYEEYDIITDEDVRDLVAAAQMKLQK